MHDRRTGRSVLCHGLRQRRMVQRRIRRPRLAGHRPCYLYHLASGYRNPVVPSLRRSVHPLSVHSHRYKPGGQGNLQDVPLHRHHRRAHHNQHAQQEGEPAAGSSGPALFP